MTEKSSTVKDAIREWEQTSGEKAVAAKELDFQFFYPPISVMDNSLLSLDKCEKLYLSTNVIGKIQNLQNMKSLTVLSLARNSITSISGLEPVAGTLVELYLSYNHINNLKGINVMTKLKTLYMNNNALRDINEVLRINDLPFIEDVAFIGNPVSERMEEQEWQQIMYKKVPTLKRLDGAFRTY
ncbi:hypothetical protein GE061_011337 [Apolygus lucorum]|uniref:Dynein axonemal light chain 1 n=1 Tax=Apolygus lucorum TaxID=248454 RepID=A0A6A4K454_APOLU|nr:hypothetical protein GE061_011337 [Apolygus lucorum]